MISQCLKRVIWPWKAGKEHLKPERKKSWLFFYSHHCYAANDYQQGNQRQECAHIHNSWRSWWGFASTAKLYLKRKFLLLINISNCVPGFKWHSAYHSQQEGATASVELPEVTAKMTGQESSRTLQKAFDLCTGSQRCCFTGLKISNNIISPSVTTLALSNTHTPGFPNPEASDKQEADMQPAFCVESGSDTLNRHTKDLAPRAPLPSAPFIFKGNKRVQQASCGVQGSAVTRTD